MNIEELTEFCQSFQYVTTQMLWDNVLVFKVDGKIFCLASLDEIPLRMNLKCNPQEAIELRERFSSVLPGFHMNKKYWNTVYVNGTVSDTLLRLWIENSYRLVIETFSRKRRGQLGV